MGIVVSQAGVYQPTLHDGRAGGDDGPDHLGGEMAAPLAYIAGTLGVLLGADLFRLRDIQDLGVPFASIGGAGTFDGIFMSGIVAVLIA
jgi:hypothetical protein